MEASAARTAEVAGVYARFFQWEYAEPCWPHHFGNEYSTTLHEGPWLPHTRFDSISNNFLDL